jgi:hypothetical protein
MLDYTPPTVRFILRALAALVGAPGPDMPPEAPQPMTSDRSDLDDDLPF